MYNTNVDETQLLLLLRLYSSCTEQIFPVYKSQLLEN